MFSQASVILFTGGGVHEEPSRGGVYGKEGCAWQRGVCMAKGGVHGRRRSMGGKRGSHCSGQYASYLNAFLFKNFFPVPQPGNQLQRSGRVPKQISGSLWNVATGHPLNHRLYKRTDKEKDRF